MHAPSDLVDRIYAGALEHGEWLGALHDVAVYLDADAGISFLPTDSGASTSWAYDFVSWGGPSEDLANRILVETGRRDAYAEAALERGLLAPGQALRGQDFCSDRVWDENPWRDLFYKPCDLRAFVGFVGRSPIDSSPILHVSLFRRAKGTPFGESEVAKLNGLRPDLERAAQMAFRLRSVAARGRSALAALDALNFEVFLVRGDGALVHANAAGERRLRRGDLFRLTGGRFGAGGEPLASRLRAAIAAAERLRASDLLVATPDGAVPVTIRPVALDATRHGALVCVLGREADESLEKRLVTLFGMTPAEAEVAAALAAGRSIKDIAGGRAVSVATVRSQLHAIFAKTGATRQAELVRTIERLSSIAPDEPAHE